MGEWGKDIPSLEEEGFLKKVTLELKDEEGLALVGREEKGPQSTEEQE